MMIDAEVARWSFWVTIATLAALYYAWSVIRVYMLRHDLYAIRNRLWETARDVEGFDDPAYLATRQQLHMLIEISHKISLPLLLYSKIKTVGSRGDVFKPNTDNVVVRKACEASLDDAATLIGRYVIRHRFFSGFILMTFIRASTHVVRGIAKVVHACKSVTGYLMNGSNAKHLANSFVSLALLTVFAKLERV